MFRIKILVLLLVYLSFVLSVWSLSPLSSSLPSSTSSQRFTKLKSSKPKERTDKSVNEFVTERTCWWNEMCKEEFSTKFRCRCPLWSYCSSPGRYYNAYCSMTGTGYLWSQTHGPSGDNFNLKRPLPYRKLQQRQSQ